MAIRRILRDDDSALKKKSRIVTDFNRRLHVLLDDMRETLAEANGSGLAAPQVGVLRRAVLVVVIKKADKPDEPAKEQVVELVNPEILEESGEQTGSEGCLSIPGVFGIVTRPEFVKVKAQDRYGKEFVLLSEKLAARAICHEVDHLNGILFTSLTTHILTEEELEQLANEGKESKREQ